eukprot:scaffold68433_cov18-Tisochrysis_lutea.AAC.1
MTTAIFILASFASLIPPLTQVYNYLASHSAGVREESAIKEFIALMEPFQLTKLEVFSIINACPTSTVEMYLLVENCDERLQEEQCIILTSLKYGSMGLACVSGKPFCARGCSYTHFRCKTCSALCMNA